MKIENSHWCESYSTVSLTDRFGCLTLGPKWTLVDPILGFAC